jgi:uncharacterized protein (UPF0548 family)
MSPTPSLDLRRQRGDLDDRLRALRGLPLNYEPRDAGGPGWHRDDYRQPLPREQPGEPEAGGSWRIACELSRSYAFSDPSLVEAHFDEKVPLGEREMLLVLHAVGLRIDVGVRVAEVRDEVTELAGRRARLFGWSYRTLAGHVEAGQRDFEVWKLIDTGEVEFRTHSYSRPAAANPIILAGFRLLGRHKQAEFGRRACERMATLTAAAAAAVAGSLPSRSPGPR